MNSLITNEHERIQAFYQRMERAMERLRVLMNEYRPVLNGERFLTDAELSERLKLSRTLIIRLALRYYIRNRI